MAEINSRSVSKVYISMAESEQFPCSEGKENIDIACPTHFEAVCLNVQMPGKVFSFVDTVHGSMVESEQFRRAEGNENIDIACATHFEAVCLKVQMPGNVYSSIDIVSHVMSKVLRIWGKHWQCIPNNLSQRPVHTFYVAELCKTSKAKFPKNLDIDIDTENEEIEKADDEMLNDSRWLISASSGFETGSGFLLNL